VRLRRRRFALPLLAALGGALGASCVGLASAGVIGLQRIDCALPNLPIQIAIQLRDAARPNHNPELAALRLQVDGLDVPATGLPTDRDVRLRAQLSPESAESYEFYDPLTNVITRRNEQLRVAWFVNAGDLRDPESAPDGSNQAKNVWHAPAEPAITHLWLVLRDDRGGVRVSDALLTTR
jgi:hypothetical protein